MADVLVDTDVLINHLRGTRQFAPPPRKSVFYSVIVRCELLAGKGVDEGAVRMLLAPFEELDVNRAVAERAGKLRRHMDILTPDALIAATALEHRLTLITENLKHFRSVPGLKVASPE